MVNESLLNKAAEAKNIVAESQLEKFQKVTGFVHEDHAQNLMTGVDADWYIPAGAYLTEDDNNEEPIVEGATGIEGATGVVEATGVEGATGVVEATGVEGTTGVVEATGVQNIPTPEEVEEHKGEEVTEENKKFDIDNDNDIDDDDVAQSELNIQGATGVEGATGAQSATGAE